MVIRNYLCEDSLFKALMNRPGGSEAISLHAHYYLAY